MRVPVRTNWTELDRGCPGFGLGEGPAETQVRTQAGLTSLSLVGARARDLASATSSPSQLTRHVRERRTKS